jgi:hypothetical protein
MKGLAIVTPGSSRAINMYTIDRNKPKKKPPNALPITMVDNEMGTSSNLSKAPLALSRAMQKIQ